MSKVILLAGDFPPIKGGIASYLHALACLFPPDEIEIIGLPTSGSYDFDSNQNLIINRLPIPQIWGPESWQFKFLASFYLWELIKKSNTDFIICGQAHHSLLIPVWIYQKLKGIPFGVIVHGIDVSSLRVHFYKKLTIKILQASRAIFANSERTALIVRKIGVKPEKIHILHPIVNTALLKSPLSPGALRKTLSLEGRKCILTVCRLVERKGCDTIIQAMPEILDKVPDAHYLIVGSGPFESELKQLTRSLGLEPHVTFTGYVDDLGPFYALCDVFAMISREIPKKQDFEGFGLVYLEANLFGKPVVAGRSGGIADAVIDDLTGILVNPESPGEVAEAVTRLLLDETISKKLGEAGRVRVLKQFSEESAIHKLHDVMSNRDIL